MNEQKEWIWLSRIEEVGSKTKHKLLMHYKTPGAIFRAKKEELAQIEGIGPKKLEKILDPKYRLNLDLYRRYMDKNHIEMVTIFEKEYPQRLKQIYDPPVVLFIKGEKKILNRPAIGIVGCRLCTSYGSKNAKKFAYNLSKYHMNIVSGLARGIDTYSHLGALKAGGTTIAVVGCGLDQVYPPENKGIFEQIIKTNGAIVSEYVVGTKPIGSNFPARNRIISGISLRSINYRSKKEKWQSYYSRIRNRARKRCLCCSW